MLKIPLARFVILVVCPVVKQFVERASEIKVEVYWKGNFRSSQPFFDCMAVHTIYLQLNVVYSNINYFANTNTSFSELREESDNQI